MKNLCICYYYYWHGKEERTEENLVVSTFGIYLIIIIIPRETVSLSTIAMRSLTAGSCWQVLFLLLIVIEIQNAIRVIRPFEMELNCTIC